MTTSARQQFWKGVQAQLPILLGVIPFGMIYGVLARSADITAGIAQAMSAVVFAGSSQFVTTQLVAEGAPWVVMVLTIGVVNLRHALYSASVAPYTRHLPGRWKAGLAYLLTDEAYATTILNYMKDHSSDGGGAAPAHKHWFFLGTGLALWSAWQGSTAVGIFLGAVIPAAWSLEFTLALTFIALVVPALKDRPDAAAAVTAGVVAVLAFGLPYKLGLIAAALAGIGAGLLVEGRRRSPENP